MRKVRVHQFVLTELTRPRSPSWRAGDLFGVSHWVDVPADTEFPHRLPRLNLFTRFYLDGARPTEFFVRVRWFRVPGGVPRLVNVFGPFLVPFASDASVRDYSFNLNNIQLHGVGLHRVDLLRVLRLRDKGRKRVRVATTYFSVER